MALRAHGKVSLIFQSVIPLVPNQIARPLATAQESVKIENVRSLGILCGAREMASNLAHCAEWPVIHSELSLGLDAGCRPVDAMALVWACQRWSEPQHAQGLPGHEVPMQPEAAQVGDRGGGYNGL